MHIFNLILCIYKAGSFSFLDLGAVLGAVGGIVSSKIGGDKAQDATEDANAAQIASAREQMEFQRVQNQKQMDFQERMSNTAHQRQVDDLRKANLNPILSAKYGGASTPSGSTSAGAQANIQSAAPYISSAYQSISNAFQSIPKNIQAMNQSRLINQQTKTESNRTTLVGRQAETEFQRTGLTMAQADAAVQSVHKIVTETRHKAAQAFGVEQENVSKAMLAKYIKNNPETISFKAWTNATGNSAVSIGKAGFDVAKKGYKGFQNIIRKYIK